MTFSASSLSHGFPVASMCFSTRLHSVYTFGTHGYNLLSTQRSCISVHSCVVMFCFIIFPNKWENLGYSKEEDDTLFWCTKTFTTIFSIVCLGLRQWELDGTFIEKANYPFSNFYTCCKCLYPLIFPTWLLQYT
jgi:hypothetical protein